MDDRLDINPVVGKSFVSSSFNVGKIQKLEDGALRVMWNTKPTDKDVAEFSDWMVSIFGDIDMTLCRNPKEEQEKLKAWKQELNPPSHQK